MVPSAGGGSGGRRRIGMGRRGHGEEEKGGEGDKRQGKEEVHNTVAYSITQAGGDV